MRDRSLGGGGCCCAFLFFHISPFAQSSVISSLSQPPRPPSHILLQPPLGFFDKCATHTCISELMMFSIGASPLEGKGGRGFGGKEGGGGEVGEGGGGSGGGGGRDG